MTVLRDIEVSKISFVGRPALRDADDGSKPQPFVLWKSEDGKENTVPDDIKDKAVAPATEPVVEPVAKAEPTQADNGVKAALALLRKNRAALSEQDRNTLVGLSKEEGAVEIDKSELPPAVQAYLQKQEEATNAAIGRADAAVAIMKAEQVRLRKAEFVTKAEAMPHIPGTGTADEFGEALMKLADAEPEAAVKLIAVLQGTEAVLSKSAMWSEMGSARVGASGSAMEKITAQATELRKHEGDTKMTMEQAIAAVLDDPKHADLYTEYKNEMARAARDSR